MKLKKTEKLVVSKKMFASSKSLKKKDSDEKSPEKPKKKEKNTSINSSPKKSATPKKKKNTSSSEPQTVRTEKSSPKSPSKPKMSKSTDKSLSSSSPSKTLVGTTSDKSNIDWSKLGVQRCLGCSFTTNEEGIFAAHLSLCRLFNEHKIKSPTPSPSKKKQVRKSDTLVTSAEKKVSTIKQVVAMPEKQAVIQEPYLEGSSPAQTVFLFRCYHCRAYFINIQTLKDHHRLAHGAKNLTVSLVPFSDDEAPEDISKKIIVDGSRIVPQVNWRRENMSVVPVNTTVTLPYSADLPIGTKDPLYSCIPLQPVGSTISTPLTVVSPKILPTTAPSETVTTRDVTIIKNPFQVTSSSDKETKSNKKAAKKETDVVQKSLTRPTILSRPKLVPVSSSMTNPSSNKMVVLNLIPKSQSVSCPPVQIGVPCTSSLNTCKQLTLTPSLAGVASKSNQESSSNWNNSTKNKAILPKSILFSVRPPPVRDLPLVLPQTSKLGPSPEVVVTTNAAQKIIQTTASQFINTSGLNSSVVAAKQKNRKIILFPLTSNASCSGTLVAPVTALTATPIAAAITTSAIVTCATTTSPSIATPLPSSLARPTLQSTVSPLLISSASTVITSNVSSVVPSVWVFPPQSSLTSVDAKLTLNQLQTSNPNQCGVLTKTIHIKSPTASTRLMQPSSTSSSMTTQAVARVIPSSNLSTSKPPNVNCSLQNQVVTITPVSEAIPTIAGKSLLEKSTIIKPSSHSPKKMQEKLDISISDVVSLKQDKAVEASSKCKKIETSANSCTDDKTNSKSTQCLLSSNNKRKITPDSDVPLLTFSVSPKKKTHISSQTSTPKSSNQNNLESAPSLSTSNSKGVDTSEDFTVALLAKKKVPVSTACNSTLQSLLNTSSNTASTSPLVIVRKSVGSNKLVVHTMVSANKLFQIQDSDDVICSLCAAKININSIRSHLYWHFHVENRNSSQCAKDSRCHYCSVIDYVISMIPKIKKPEKFEEISSQTSPKPLTEEQLQSDITVVEDSCLPVDSSTNGVDTEPLGLKISSTFSLQSEGNILKNEEKSQELMNLKPELEKEKQTEGQEDQPQSSSDLPETTLAKDDESSENITKEGCTTENPVLDVQNTNETENPQKVDSKGGEETSDKSPVKPSKNFKLETPSQAEKNSIYKGNFYICGFKECTFSSLCKEDFEAHQENEHSEARSYSCVHCQLECLESEMLVHHMDSHLCGEMFILYRCAFPECNFGTNLMKSFIDHNVETHSTETVFLCYYCNANFQGCTALHKHLRANLLKYVHCPHCSVRNGLRDVILTHIKSDHPDKPRRIFVTGQMVCHQKQKVLDGITGLDSESDSSDIDSDCMIVDDDILDRHLIKQTNISVRDMIVKSVGKVSESVKTSTEGRTISERKNSSSSEGDSDCMIVDDEKEVDPKKSCGRSNVSLKADSVQDNMDSNKLSKTLIKSPSLKKNEGSISKQTDNIAVTVLNASNFSKEKNSSEVSTNLVSANTDKDGSESEEGSVYLQVKKVTHTYSRQKENRLSLKQHQLEDNPKFDKDNSNEKSPQDSVSLARSCKRRLLIRNKPHGKGDIGTKRLDAVVRPLYLLVDNEVHCRICTFKCVPLQKMHTHILHMHLHVFLYQCKFCLKKCSCKIEMTEHCEQHGQNNEGFVVLPEPDWDQVIRSCLPDTFKASNLKSPVAEATDIQTLAFSNKAKLTKTELALSPKIISPGSKRKSLEVLDSAGCKISIKENSSKLSSSNAKISSNEDRNIFSIFSFSLESDTEMQYIEEEPENLDSRNSSNQRKFDSSFSNRLFTLPNLSNFDKTPVKNLPPQELPQRTPTPEGHDQITVGKEQYMRELHLISISEVSNCKHKNKSLSPVPMSSRSSKYRNTAMAKLRSWRTTHERTAFSLVSKSSPAKTPKKTLPCRSMLITPKTLRKKVLSKTSKLKIKRVQNRRSTNEGHLLRSAFKVRHSPRTLKRRMEARESLLKTPQKYVTRKRPQSSKSPSSCPRTKSTQSTSSKSKISKHLAVNRKKVKNTSRKLNSSVRTVVKKKNLTITYGKRSIKKALNRASR